MQISVGLRWGPYASLGPKYTSRNTDFQDNKLSLSHPRIYSDQSNDTNKHQVLFSTSWWHKSTEIMQGSKKSSNSTLARRGFRGLILQRTPRLQTSMEGSNSAQMCHFSLKKKHFFPTPQEFKDPLRCLKGFLARHEEPLWALTIFSTFTVSDFSQDT